MREENVVVCGFVKCLRETEKGILVVAAGEGMKTTPGDSNVEVETWMPKKAVADDSEVKATGDAGTLTVREWYAKLNKWPGFEQGLPPRKRGPSPAPEDERPAIRGRDLLERIEKLELRVLELENAPR